MAILRTNEHGQKHTMTSTSDHSATADRIFYSNNSGDVTELALGAAGTFLHSPGTTSAPIYVYPQVQGGLINGKLSVTVSANDLIVALKGLDGNDPSATNPVYCRIGNTIRACTAALSKTLADGTNWFNAGSAELATQDVDYFAYLIWNTGANPDVVDIGFARISHGITYADFSVTSTNEKYLAYGNGSAPNSTDEVEVIGRFNATLSASASYNWSISTPVVVNSPIFETRVLTWAPTFSASGSMTFTSVAADPAKYKVFRNTFDVFLSATGTTGGTASVSLRATLPFIPSSPANSFRTGCGVVDTGSIGGFTFLAGGGSSTVINARKYDSSNFGLGANREMHIFQTCQIA